MVNRERFMLDVDSEGFPQRYDDVPHPPASLAGLNVGRTADHAIVQALLADHKCGSCVAIPNQPLTAADQAFIDAHEHLHEIVAARQLVREADQNMDGPWTAPDWAFGQREKGEVLRVHGALDLSEMRGVERLSDSAAPDAYFGWKS